MVLHIKEQDSEMVLILKGGCLQYFNTVYIADSHHTHGNEDKYALYEMLTSTDKLILAIYYKFGHFCGVLMLLFLEDFIRQARHT